MLWFDLRQRLRRRRLVEVELHHAAVDPNLVAVRRAYSPAQFERLAATSPFQACGITIEGIGLEVRLQKLI